MTAVINVSAETRSERIAREQKEWIADAVAYMIMIGLYAQEEVYEALYLAEILAEEGCRDGEIVFTAKEAVDEELSYWGD
uniref:Uncharacterized protein n=2 Tax=unclassified bacterial viruses TaxID=12333 RepID=A0AAU6VY91_9VIRU